MNCNITWREWQQSVWLFHTANVACHTANSQGCFVRAAALGRLAGSRWKRIVSVTRYTSNKATCRHKLTKSCICWLIEEGTGGKLLPWATSNMTVNLLACGRVMCDVWCVMCDVWCVMCDVWSVMCDVWCVMCDVWCVMCDVWCVMCDVWCVMCDVWCVMCDVSTTSHCPHLYAMPRMQPSSHLNNGHTKRPYVAFSTDF